MNSYFGFIYKWTDSTNGRNYTGSHEGSTEDKYTGSGTLFKRAYKKRPEAFTKEILEYVYEDDRKILLETEQKYLDLIDWSSTYNISTIARGSDGMKGKRHKEESKRKISKNHKGMLGKKRSEESKQRQSEKMKDKIPWNKGIPCTEKHRKNISESKKGYKHKEKSKQKIGIGSKGRNKGKTYEEIHGEEKAKELKGQCSERMKGQKRGPYKKNS